MYTDTVWDDRFSPDFGCRVPLDWQKCDDMTHWDDMTYWECLELLDDDSDSSEDCGCGPPGDFDLYDLRDY